jgi:NAD+ synthetase
MPPLVNLAIVQFNPRKGDYAGNVERLGTVLAQFDSVEPYPDLVLLPESAATGYFLEGGVRELARTAGTFAADLDAAARAAGRTDRPIDVAIGFYEIWKNTLHNSAMCVTLGGDGPHIRHVHRKVFLPTYGMFDEERFVDRGREIRAFDLPWGRAAMLVCEDAWHSLSGTLAALDGAQVILLHAAAPARGAWPRADDTPGPATLARWERLTRDIAEEHGVYVALAHLVGNEGGKTFAGGSMIAGPKGDVRIRGPLWEEAIITLTLDLADLTRARADMPLITDLQAMLPHLLDSLGRIDAGVPHRVEYDEDRAPDGADLAPGADGGADGRSRSSRLSPGRGAVRRSGGRRGASARERTAGSKGGRKAPTGKAATGKARRSSIEAAVSPALPVVTLAPGELAGPPPLDIQPDLAADWLINFIRSEVHRRGFRRSVIGVSGGVDSAVTAYLAARALGPENVIALRLPYRTSNPESLAHAKLVTDALGITERTIDISAAVDGYLATEPDADPSRRGNIMARLRMIALFDLSAKHHALPLGTGNKTERLFGYFTWHADDSPPINPLGDLYKTQVWALARHLGVPGVIVDKPATADLIVGQTDEVDLGISYAKADLILNWLLSGYGANDLETRGFDRREVEVVRRRLESTHWKRRLPTVAMVSPSAIGEAYLRPVDY